MSKNGIAWLSTKEERQKAKLEIAQAKRQGRTVADNGIISGGIDSTKNYYRNNNEYDITELPTRYIGNDVIDNPNPDGLLPARPWISIVEVALTTENDIILSTEDGIIIVV